MKHLSYLVGACLSAALLTACGGSSGLSPSTPTVAPLIATSPSKQLVPQEVLIARRHVFPATSCSKAACAYVTNGSLAYSAPPPSVTVYAANANGNVPPIRTISGSRARLNRPVGIALDAGGNMYVANSCSSIVTVYDPGANGNAAPIRTIAGSNTGLASPNGIALDRRGTLYVANGNGSVVVYAPGAHGNVSPIRMISGSSTGFHSEVGVALAANGNLQVLDIYCTGFPVRCTSSLLVFGRDANGNVAPIRSRSLGMEALGIALDEHGETFLPGFQIFGFAPRVVVLGRSGRHIIGRIRGRKTQLFDPHAIAVAEYGSVYVTNADSVTVYARNAHGDVAPIRTISGSNTGLAAPNGIAVH
jgi:hypothetical protein